MATHIRINQDCVTLGMSHEENKNYLLQYTTSDMCFVFSHLVDILMSMVWQNMTGTQLFKG